MPSIELPIRSLSILFLFGAIVAILWFPDNPLTPDLSRALFWWFLALGIVRWVENGVMYLLPSDIEGDWGTFWKVLRYFVAITAFGFFVWFLIKGILYFVYALDKLS